MPCTKGRGPLVSRGTHYVFSIDPATRARLDRAIDAVNKRMQMQVSRSAIVRRAVQLHAAHLEDIEGQPNESLPVLSESVRISECIRGSQHA